MKDGATVLRGTADHLWAAKRQEAWVYLAWLSCGNGIWFPNFPRWHTCWGQGLISASLCLPDAGFCSSHSIFIKRVINEYDSSVVVFFKIFFLSQFLLFAAGPGMEKKKGGRCLQRSLKTLCSGQRLKAHLVLILCLVCKVDPCANTLNAAQLKLPATWYLSGSNKGQKPALN